MLKIYFVCITYLLIATDTVRCESDYIYNNEVGGWLKMHTIPATWEEAMLTCHREGAVLASPLDKQLVTALHSLMTQSCVYQHIFLGTHDLYSTGNFGSVEGVPLSNMEIKWCADHKKADNERCLTMSIDGHEHYMYTSSCSEPLPYICYKKPVNHTMNGCGTFDNDTARCKPDYIFNNEAGGWLKLQTTPATWEEALVRCHREGAVLASPLNKQLVTALHSLMTQSGVNQHIYLGTHDLYSKCAFVSVEGVPLSNMEIRWGADHKKADNERCLTMSIDGPEHYMYTSSCTEPLPYICYKKLDNLTMNECGTFDNEYHLSRPTGSCYKVHEEKQIWEHAYKICAFEGGHLVILNDKEEARIVKDLLPVRSGDASQWEQFHIGLRTWGNTRTWMTIHGERIEDVFHDWYPGQLEYTSTTSAIFYRAGTLGTEWLTSRKMFICEKSPRSTRFEGSTLSPCEK